MRYFNIPQWIWRRLSRRCPSRVWLTLHPGRLRSSVRNPLYGINYKAGREEEKTSSHWSVRLRVLRCPGWQHIWILRLSPKQLRLWRRGRNLLATGCWSSLAWWVLSSVSPLSPSLSPVRFNTNSSPETETISWLVSVKSPSNLKDVEKKCNWIFNYFAR